MKDENVDTLPERKTYINPFDSVIKYLPLGYLYLLILGIGKDSIFYGILGINIMNYSNVLDVLLSPVAQLTGSVLFLVAIIGIMVFGTFYIKLILYFQAKKNKKKPAFFESMNFKVLWLYFTAFSIFCAFLGFGIGGGKMKLKKLENQELHMSNRLTFENKEVLDVAIIGSNSGFIFYALKGEKTIKISPIQNLQMIEKLAD